MNLGEIIYQYRQEHHLSQRQFAIRCKLSNGYIAMLENGMNPQTGKEIKPTLAAVKEIAKAMQMDADELIRMMDNDLYIRLSTEYEDEFSDEKQRKQNIFKNMDPLDEEMFERYQSLSEERKRLVLQMIKEFSSHQ